MSDVNTKGHRRSKGNKDDSVLTEKQKTLPAELKQKIIESKKSGAGYSGDENYNK